MWRKKNLHLCNQCQIFFIALLIVSNLEKMIILPSVLFRLMHFLILNHYFPPIWSCHNMYSLPMQRYKLQLQRSLTIKMTNWLLIIFAKFRWQFNYWNCPHLGNVNGAKYAHWCGVPFLSFIGSIVVFTNYRVSKSKT